MILSDKRKKWVKQFKPSRLRGKVLMPNASIRAKYEKSLLKLIRKMTLLTEAKILSLYEKPHAEEYFATDDTISSQARILLNQLKGKFDDLFGFHAADLASEMLNDTEEYSASSLKGSLKELSGGLSLKTDFISGDLKEAFKASITENVSLIKSIPQNYFNQIEGAVMRSITTGRGLADLQPFIKKYKGVTERRAKNIAEDQTRKAYSNLSRIRMERMGLKQFEWIHSGGGQHPRKLHKELSEQIFSFDQPPVIDERTGERGFPGQLINCRCVMRSVVTFEGEDDE